MRPQKEILEIFDILSANDPAPKSELEYSNAFTLLVAIVLSAQSTDKGVNKAPKSCLRWPIRRPRWPRSGWKS